MRFVGILGAIGLLLVTTAAQAGGDGLTPSDRAELDAVMKEAYAHARKGEYEAARVGYAKAYETFPTTPVLFNLAVAELKTGHELDALHHFDLYVAMDDAEKLKVDAVRKELRPLAYAATGHVLIEGAAPAGARISVDGHELAEADARQVDVTPGEHEVIARTKDATWRSHVNAPPGQSTAVSFELVARTPPPPAPAAAPTPAAAPAGLPRFAGSLEAERAPEPEPPFWNTGRVLSAVALGGAVVAAGTGLAFRLESDASSSHAADVRAQLAPGACAPPVPAGNASSCSDLRNSVNNQATFANLSTGLFIGAGALAVAGAVLYAAWPSSAPLKKGALVPVVDPRSRTAGFVGSFAF